MSKSSPKRRRMHAFGSETAAERLYKYAFLKVFLRVLRFYLFLHTCRKNEKSYDTAGGFSLDERAEQQSSRYDRNSTVDPPTPTFEDENELIEDDDANGNANQTGMKFF
jgi:hypothetical protein